MTIAENIAYAKPGAPLADVRGAARLANAEGFILQMDGGCEIEGEIRAGSASEVTGGEGTTRLERGTTRL